MERAITGLLIVVGIIHILPITGFLGLNQLNQLYDIDLADSNLEILMRHRAILFGLLGAFICYAGFVPALQPLAFIAGFISIGSFIFLAVSVGDYNGAIQRVVYADYVAAVCLIIAIILFFIRTTR